MVNRIVRVALLAGVARCAAACANEEAEPTPETGVRASERAVHWHGKTAALSSGHFDL